MGKEHKKEKKPKNNSVSNGTVVEGEGQSMQPPVFQLQGDKNKKTDDKSSSGFMGAVGSMASVASDMISGIGEIITDVVTLVKVLAMSKAERDKLRKDKDRLDELQKELPAGHFAIAAAAIIIDTPASCDDQKAAEAEARRVISAQLGNKEMARKSIDANIEVVVIPRSKLMTDITQFSSLKGKKTFDGREWDPVRGSGGMAVGGKICTAITEENLLGGKCTAVHNGAPLNTGYEEGYSTTTHEFAHTLHNHVLDAKDKKAITKAYKARKKKALKKPDDVNQWVDGKEGCYASMTEHEFFAQLSNAYLGTNAGKDPYVGSDRHNTKKWVEDHEPEMYALLQKMYSGAKVDNANPKKP
jgi:hypothetical protein